jgi:hypothetical protein
VTAWTERVSLERIAEQTREIRPGRTILTWIAAALFALGWVVCRVVAVAWLVCAWSFVAVREGWREAAGAKVNRGAGRPD